MTWVLDDEDLFLDESSFNQRWSFEVGANIRNNEQQTYVGGLNTNTFLTQDGLVLRARKEGEIYTSASILSKDTWKNFAIEVVAKTATGKGLWPAIWLIDRTDGIVCEIDLMEDPNLATNRVYMNFHCGTSYEENGRLQVPATRYIHDFTNRFITYRGEFTPDHISIYVDGVRVNQISRNQKDPSGLYTPMKEAVGLKINLALGGDWAGSVSDSALPADFTIKSVKRWKYQ